MLEAIIDSSERPLIGDKLNYIVKVASNKWKEAQEVASGEIDYANALEQSKKATQKANLALEKRVLKRKGKR